MKKILFILLAFCAIQVSAQTDKEKAAFQKKLAKSDEDIADPKKGMDPKTWMNRGALFMEIYESPVKNVMLGMPQLQVKAVMKDQKARTDNQELNGVSYEIMKYPNLKLYFDETGTLAFWEVEEQFIENPLHKAYDSYVKAYELDTKKSNVKKINEALKLISNKMIGEAQGAYNLGKFDLAMRYFEGSLACSDHPAVNVTDTLIIYNTALVARLAGENDKALSYYKKALDLGYDAQGSAYANYATLLREKGDTVKAMDILSKAFVKYPKSQDILVSLINAYLTSGKNLSDVIPYIKQGQENEPNNASLYYAEGVVYQNLNNTDKALECFNKAIDLDPNNYATMYSAGALFYNRAVELQEKAQDPNLSQEDYDKLIADMESNFEKAIPYLTKAYELMPNERSIVESLRGIYYRFQEKNPEMKEKYEFYDNLFKKMQ